MRTTTRLLFPPGIENLQAILHSHVIMPKLLYYCLYNKILIHCTYSQPTYVIFCMLFQFTYSILDYNTYFIIFCYHVFYVRLWGETFFFFQCRFRYYFFLSTLSVGAFYYLHIVGIGVETVIQLDYEKYAAISLPCMVDEFVWIFLNSISNPICISYFNR